MFVRSAAAAAGRTASAAVARSAAAAAAASAPAARRAAVRAAATASSSSSSAAAAAAAPAVATAAGAAAAAAAAAAVAAVRPAAAAVASRGVSVAARTGASAAAGAAGASDDDGGAGFGSAPAWAAEYSNIRVGLDSESRVAMVRLHRPRALNALCDALMAEVNDALARIDLDDSIGCTVITGSDKAFAAGADIKEMAPRTQMEVYNGNMFASWADVAKRSKPIIAAVNGYALGGGCELAMMCDVILAGDKAKFAQPEITLGTIPGGGGTQRLVKAVGKSLAMDMCLTGEMINAQRALEAGLVAHVVPADELEAFAIGKATKIASFSRPIVAMTKEAVNQAFETPLEQGLLFERRAFHSTFGTKDQKEGMQAFANKTKPVWSHE